MHRGRLDQRSRVVHKAMPQYILRMQRMHRRDALAPGGPKSIAKERTQANSEAVVTHNMQDLSLCTGVGRSELEARIGSLVYWLEEARSELAKANRQQREVIDNLTAVQKRCTELRLELRAYRASGICLPGWWCPCEVTTESPGIFNGSVREVRTHCRVCGRPRPK